MKFEDLKLPQLDLAFDRCEDRDRVARAVYDQMRAHYEAKLAEAKLEPEELFEHPKMPGKKFRRLKVGEVIREGDWTASKGSPPGEVFLKTVCAGLFVESGDANYFYREVPQPAPEWRLPDPPPGQQWHRDDWTQDMLPEGYRPLLLGEKPEEGDQILFLDKWKQLNVHQLRYPVRLGEFHQRTCRPLPAPVEYVPLEPGDVPPGSAVRISGYNGGWALVTGVDKWGLYMADSKESWESLAEDHVILRPNSTTWEPCKKPKA